MALNDNITALERFTSVTITDDTGNNLMTLRMTEFIESITRQVNQNIVINGTGSPEGVLVAEPFKIYIDTAADTTYYKKTGAGNTGWALLA
tara:strand:- start:1306 stop:1578 length:273 start_codon:yes stop_codon:yes gene_type:complete